MPNTPRNLYGSTPMSIADTNVGCAMTPTNYSLRLRVEVIMHAHLMGPGVAKPVNGYE